jgi:hypothetical protein
MAPPDWGGFLNDFFLLCCFVIFHKNATFQVQIINLPLKNKNKKQFSA